MDANLKQMWIAALRSGNYQQGHGLLRQGDCYCCLGVLCDAAKIASWENTDDERGNDHWYATTPIMNGEMHPLFDDLLPTKVLDAIGLPDQLQERCWKMNDEDGKSFAEIADFIEANL